MGVNIERVESVMQIEADGTGTRFTHRSEVQPGFWFPPLIGPALVRHETAEQFSAMLRRQ